MNTIKINLEEDIDRLRNELDNLLKTKSCLSLEVLKVSQMLDTLIVDYYNPCK